MTTGRDFIEPQDAFLMPRRSKQGEEKKTSLEREESALRGSGYPEMDVPLDPPEEGSSRERRSPGEEGAPLPIGYEDLNPLEGTPGALDPGRERPSPAGGMFLDPSYFAKKPPQQGGRSGRGGSGRDKPPRGAKYIPASPTGKGNPDPDHLKKPDSSSSDEFI